MFKHPFDVISSNDLGKSTSSFASIGSLQANRSFGQAGLQIYANVACGNLFIEDHMKKIVDFGFTTKLGMTYNSQATQADQAWRFSLGKTIGTVTGTENTVGSTVNVIQEDGSSILFTFDTQQNCYVASGLADGNQYLSYNSDNSTWECWQPKTGITEHFDKNNRQTDRADAFGHQFNFIYDNDGNLIQVQRPSGQTIQLDWQGNQLNLLLIDQNNKQTLLMQYEFDDLDRLKTTTIPIDNNNNYVITYNYIGNTAQLENITQTDNTALNFSYQQNQLNKITDGEDRAYTINYANQQTQISDALNDTTAFGFDNQDHLTTLVKPDDNGTTETTSYAYYNNGALQQITYPDKTIESYLYDNLGLLTEYTDGLNQITDYYNDPNTGALISKTEYLIHPDKSETSFTTYFVNNAQRQLCYIIAPSGSVTQFNYDNNGNRISAKTHLSAKIDTSQFKPNVPIDKSIVDNWWNQQDQNQISLTTYQYNNAGQINLEQSFTEINDQGQGIFNDGTSQIQTVWGLFDQWQSISERQTTTLTTTKSQSFDGLNRITSSINEENAQTIYQYQDAQSTVTVILPNQLQQQTVFDTSGLSKTYTEQFQQQQRTTNYIRDNAGRIQIIQQPDKRCRYRYYDPQGRLAFTIDPEGYVTERRYDQRGHLQLKIRYYSNIKINPNQLPTYQQLLQMIAVSSKDRCEYKFYDAAQRLQYEIKGENSITEYLYDSRNLKIGKIAYATPVSDDQISALLSGQSIQMTATAKDRQTYFYYDDDKRLIGKLTGLESGLEIMLPRNAHEFKIQLEQWQKRQGKGDTLFIFNPEKQQWQAYLLLNDKKELEQKNLAAGSLFTAELTRLNSRDKIIHNKNKFYELLQANQLFQNRIVETGYVTEYLRDAGGRIYEKIKYANKSEYAFSFDQVRPAPSPNDAHFQYLRDARGQKILQVDAENYLTTYQHLPTGLLEKQNIYNNPLHADKDKLSKDVKPEIDPENDEFISFEYDKLKRQTLKYEQTLGRKTIDRFDIVGHHTENTIQDAKNPQDSRSNGKVFDPFSQVTQEINSRQGKTSHVYDDISGLRLATIDPVNNKTVFYYNDRRQLCFSVSAGGCIQQLEYDAYDKPIRLRTYDKRLSKEQIANLQGGFLTPEVKEFFALQIDEQKDSVTQCEYDRSGLLVEEVDPEGFVKTQIYNAFNELIQKTKQIDKENKNLIELYDNDNRGLEQTYIKDPDGENITTQKIRNNIDGQITTYIDENNNSHNYDYDRLSREKTYTDPLGQSSKKKWDAFNRPTETIDRCQKNTLYFQNTAKRTQVQLTPAGRSITSTYNIFKQTKTSKDDNNAVYSYEYDRGGEITEQIDPLQRKIIDIYDLAGRHQKHIAKNGVTTFNEFDADNGIAAQIDSSNNNNAINLKTEYQRDTRGKEIARKNPLGVWTTKARDRRGLEINVTVDATTENNSEGLNLSTINLYNGLQQKELCLQGDRVNPTQRVTQFAYDSAARETGNQIDPFGLNINSSKTLDAKGNTIAVKDPNGNLMRNVLDALDRKRFTIGPKGTVTELRYDNEGRLLWRCAYLTPIDPAEINNNSTPNDVAQLIQTSGSDRCQYYRYDNDGKQIFAISSQGYVIETLRDAAGRSIGQTRYYNKIDPTKLTTNDPSEVRKALTPEFAKDRTTFSLLDLDGQLRFEIDGEGAVKENQYDERGNIIAKIVYANKIDTRPLLAMAAQRATAPALIQTVINAISQSPDDRITYQAFDALNRPQYIIDPEKYVIQYVYDDEDNLIQTIRYDQKIAIPAKITAENIAALLPASPNPKIDRITNIKYDAAQRKVAVQDGLGNSEVYTLDALKQLIKKKDKRGYLWQAIFDNAGRKIIERTPETTVVQVTQDPNTLQLSSKAIRTNIDKKSEHDANGNVLSVTEAANLPEARTINYDYDENNQQIESSINNVAIDDPDITPTSPNQRPEKTVTLMTATAYNIWGQPVVLKDENGNLSFKSYDNDGRLIYEVDSNLYVTEYQRNAFGESEQVIRHNTPLNIQPNAFADKGLSVEHIRANLKDDPQNDRMISTQYNRCGQKTMVQLTKVFIYNAYKNKFTYCFAAPTTFYDRNAFGEVIYKASLIDPTQQRWSIRRVWRDHRGDVIAETDPNNHITFSEFNADRKSVKKIEMAEPVPPNQLKKISFQELKKLAAEQSKSSKNRTFIFQYDVLGQLLKSYQEDIVTQNVALDKNGIPQMNDNELRNLGKEYERDAEGRAIKTTNENGAVETTQFDEIGRASLEIKPPRTTFAKESFQAQIEKQKQSLFLRAKLPKSNQLIAFEEKLLMPNSDNGFIILGVTREKLADYLLSLKNQKDAREFLSKEIYSALLNAENGFTAPDDTWNQLLSEKNAHAKNLDDLLKKIQVNLTDEKIKSLPIKELIDWLRKNQQLDNAKSLEQTVTTIELYESMLSEYCKKPEVFAHYANAIQNKNLSLGYKSALLYAFSANIALYIWQRDYQNPKQLNLLQYNQVNQPSKTIHLLGVSGFTGFHLLTETKLSEEILDQNPKDKSPAIYFEMIQHGYNAHGNQNLIQRMNRTTPEKFKFGDVQNDDQITLRIFDLGLLRTEQDPENAISYKSYTATKKTARDWQWITAWQQSTSDPTQFTTVLRLHQTRWEYDAVNNETAECRLEYTGEETITIKQYNGFNEVIAVGSRGFELDIICPKDQQEYEQRFKHWHTVHKTNRLLFIFSPEEQVWKACLVKKSKKDYEEKIIENDSAFAKELQSIVSQKNIMASVSSEEFSDKSADNQLPFSHGEKDRMRGNYPKDYVNPKNAATYNKANLKKLFKDHHLFNHPIHDALLWYVFYFYDQAGRQYMTNENNGITTLTLCNAVNATTCTATSRQIDLSQYGPADLPNIVNWDFTRLQKTEVVLDDNSQVEQQNLPSFKRLKPDMPEPLYVGVTVGSDYPTFGEYSFTWPQPAQQNFIATLKLWVKDTSNPNIHNLPITINNGRMGADVTKLIADIYEYEIEYFYQDPQTNQIGTQVLYRARGVVPLDTANTLGSKHLVLVQVSDSQIVLTGKTENLSGIELIQNNTVVARLAGSTCNVFGRWVFDLSDQVTGTYTCRPIYGFTKIGQPVSIGQSNSQFSLEVHSTSIGLSQVGRSGPIQNLSESPRMGPELAISNQITWSDLPPGCTQLQGTFAFNTNLNYQPLPYIYNWSGLNYITDQFPTSQGWHEYGNLASYVTWDFSSVSSLLYVLDNQQQPWLIGNGANPLYPNNSGVPGPILYIVPVNQPINADAITILEPNKPIATLPLSVWMNGMQKVNIAQISNYQNYQYQLLQLNAQLSPAEELQPFTIFTVKPSAKLSVREIAQDNLQLGYGNNNNPNINPRQPGYIFNWQLPQDLDGAIFHLIGSAIPWQSNNTLVFDLYFSRASDWSVLPAFFACSFSQVQLSVMIGQDYVPLLNGEPYDVVANEQGLFSYFQFRVATFANLPNNIASVNFEYYDFTLGSAATWRPIEDIQFSQNKTTMVVNTLPLQFGTYNYRFKAFDANGKQIDLSAITTVDDAGFAVGQFKVGGANVYTSSPLPELFETISPVRQQKTDRWNNVIESTDALNNTTTFIIGPRNELQQTIKPQITITNEDGTQQEIQPIITHGYDAIKQLIGVRDANGFVTAYFRNLLGELIEKVDADGVWLKFNLDGFGRAIILINGMNFVTQQFFDRRDCIIKVTDANSWNTVTAYNELKRQLSIADGENNTTRNDYNNQGDVTIVYQPGGQKSVKVFDRNHELVSFDDGTGQPLVNSLDFWGVKLGFVDKGGATYVITLNLNKQIISQQSSGGSHGQQYAPDGKTLQQVPNQNLMYVLDEASNITYLLDNGVGLTTRYRLDASSRRIGEWFMASDGRVHQDLRVVFDACNRIIELIEMAMGVKGTYGFDANDNRRFTIVYYNWNNVQNVYSLQNWYTYTNAGRMVIVCGDFKNGKIQLTSDKPNCMQLSYQGGWRIAEIYIASGRTCTNSITYYPNGLVSGLTNGSNGSTDTYSYYENNARASDTNWSPSNKQTTVTATYYNGNLWISSQTVTINNQLVMSTSYTGYDNASRPLTLAINYPLSQVTQNLTSQYVGFTDMKIIQTSGTQNGSTQVTTLFVTNDANGNVQSVNGAVTGGFRIMVTNSENRIVLAANGAVDNNQNEHEYHVYDANGDVMGQFGDLPDPKGPPSNVNFDLNIHPIDSNFPSSTPSKYTVQTGDDWKKISENVYNGDSSYADDIARANNYSKNDPAPVGNPITIPSLAQSNMHNRGDMFATYNEARIIGSLYPNMPIPQPKPPKPPHHSFWKEALEVAVGVAILAFEPELAPMLASFLLGPALAATLGGEILGSVLAGAALGIASSFAQQETSRALGDQDHFSWHEMWQSGLLNAESAGLSYGLGFSFNPATKLGFLTNIGESEEYAIGMQLLQLAFKQERKFDWKSLITAALTAEANDAIAHIPGFQQNPGGTFFHPAPPNLRNTFASTFTDDFITSEVETRHFNAEDAAAQALGTVAGLALAQEARNVHNDYKNKQEQKLLQSYYADQDFQKTRQRINATDAALESFGEAQDANFKAMLNTNPFTGEPLDATDPMDPSQQSDDKTPSYQQRQDAHDQSQSKAQQWNAQVNQNTWATQHPQENNDDPLLEAAHLGLGIAAIGTGLGEFSNVMDGQWQGLNGKWYSMFSKFRGNQHTGSMNDAIETAEKFRTGGAIAFWADAGLSLWQGTDAAINNQFLDADKNALDIFMAGVGFTMGPPGLAISSLYFAINALGWKATIQTAYEEDQKELNENLNNMGMKFGD